MVVKPRLLLATTTALALVVTAAAPMAASFQEATPSPLREATLLRVKDIAANGNTSKGAIVAVGWREASKPAQLFLAFSTNGGKDYRRSNGNLRKYPILGDGRLGMSLAICSGRVWAGSGFHNPSDPDAVDTDVLLTSRTIGGGAAQAFMTDTTARRKVRDVSVACVGKDLLAIAWLEQSGGKNKAKLMFRSMEPLGEKAVFRKTFGLGTARFKDGISVAAANGWVHVAWGKGDQQDLRLKRFLVTGDGTPVVDPQPATTISFRDARFPQLAARGSRVVIAYTDAGKVKAKVSDDLGEIYAKARTILATGSIATPSKAYSADVFGGRIVVEASSNKAGALTPLRIQSRDAGATWASRVFGHKGARVGALMKKKGKPALLREAWHNNSTISDTLRAQYERP